MSVLWAAPERCWTTVKGLGGELQTMACRPDCYGNPADHCRVHGDKSRVVEGELRGICGAASV